MPNITISLTVSDANVARVLDAFSGLAGKEILFTILDTTLQDEQWRFTFEPKQIGETNQQFALRVVKDTIVALIRLQDYAEDKARYETEIDAVEPVAQDVPDNIIM
jgi:hypothetical protein